MVITDVGCHGLLDTCAFIWTQCMPLLAEFIGFDTPLASCLFGVLVLVHGLSRPVPQALPAKICSLIFLLGTLTNSRKVTRAFLSGRKPGHKQSGLVPPICYYGPSSKKNILAWPSTTKRIALAKWANPICHPGRCRRGPTQSC
jgi:hypothetical protein